MERLCQLMKQSARPYREVHLDFHTSPDLPDIGSRFSKENFQKALQVGHIDSITVFAKCHHGLCYYPTTIGKMHPNLTFDLTGAMVEAAHEVGVRAPIYITAGWSDLDADAHPEWVSRYQDGSMQTMNDYDESAATTSKKPECCWRTLCLNDGSYAQQIYAQTEEICVRYKELDGLFYDICVVGDVCYCDECLTGMRKMGLDPKNEANAKAYFALKRTEFMEKCRRILHSYHPNATLFFNSGGADQYRPEYHPYQTHYEMEDLPTAWDGYDKLPIRAKYFSQLHKPFLGMTGKFHLAWGEFGGFKSREALKYEIATMATYGAACSIGDHMHPDGEMELETYRNIGYAYKYLEKIAPYCFNGKTLSNLGIYLSPDHDANEGLSKILLENQLDYRLVFDDNYQGFDTVIFPNGIRLTNEGVKKCNDFLQGGGKVLFMGDALLQNGRFQIDGGVAYLGQPEFDCDYIRLLVKSDLDLPDAPMLCNLPAERVTLTDGECLATIQTPYFSRTYGHYCGHKNTPFDKKKTPLPAIVQKGNVVYMAHSMPRQYFEFGSLYSKRYLMFALSRLYKGPLYTIKGMGSAGRATLIHQPQHRRYCMNITYASPVKRGAAEVIEDILPLHNIEITARLLHRIQKVTLPLSGERLAFSQNDGIVHVTLPKLLCHESIVFWYE